MTAKVITDFFQYKQWRMIKPSLYNCFLLIILNFTRELVQFDAERPLLHLTLKLNGWASVNGELCEKTANFFIPDQIFLPKLLSKIKPFISDLAPMTYFIYRRHISTQSLRSLRHELINQPITFWILIWIATPTRYNGTQIKISHVFAVDFVINDVWRAISQTIKNSHASSSSRSQREINEKYGARPNRNTFCSKLTHPRLPRISQIHFGIKSEGRRSKTNSCCTWFTGLHIYLKFMGTDEQMQHNGERHLMCLFLHGSCCTVDDLTSSTRQMSLTGNNEKRVITE